MRRCSACSRAEPAITRLAMVEVHAASAEAPERCERAIALLRGELDGI
jgi:hypothetical protein